MGVNKYVWAPHRFAARKDFWCVCALDRLRRSSAQTHQELLAPQAGWLKLAHVRVLVNEVISEQGEDKPSPLLWTLNPLLVGFDVHSRGDGLSSPGSRCKNPTPGRFKSPREVRSDGMASVPHGVGLRLPW